MKQTAFHACYFAYIYVCDFNQNRRITEIYAAAILANIQATTTKCIKQERLLGTGTKMVGNVQFEVASICGVRKTVIYFEVIFNLS